MPLNKSCVKILFCSRKLGCNEIIKNLTFLCFRNIFIKDGLFILDFKKEFLLYGLCCEVCEPNVSYSDADAAVSLHVMLMMQTCMICRLARDFFLRCCKSCASFMQSSQSYHLSCVLLSFCLKWNLFFWNCFVYFFTFSCMCETGTSGSFLNLQQHL